MDIKGFLKYLKFEKRYADNTLISYSNDLTQFSNYLANSYGELAANEVRHTHVRSWIVEMMEVGISTRSINRKLSSLKSFYKYLKRKGDITVDPLAKVQSPKVSKRLPEFVEERQMQQLMELLPKGEEFKDLRDRIVLMLLYATGIRRAELLGLKLSDINLDAHQLKVMGKGSKERIVPFSAQVAQEIQKYIAIRNLQADVNTDKLILGNSGKPAYPKLIYNIVQKYLGQVSTLRKKSPHVLRHTFATHLSNEGADLNAIKELLGHANLSATQVYMHNSISKLKAIHKKSHPKA